MECDAAEAEAVAVLEAEAKAEAVAKVMEVQQMQALSDLTLPFTGKYGVKRGKRSLPRPSRPVWTKDSEETHIWQADQYQPCQLRHAKLADPRWQEEDETKLMMHKAIGDDSSRLVRWRPRPRQSSSTADRRQAMANPFRLEAIQEVKSQENSSSCHSPTQF